MFEGVRQEYRQVEPDGVDRWNPLFMETELWHRLRLFAEMREVLVRIGQPVEQCRILDVGCGVGRSTREMWPRLDPATSRYRILCGLVITLREDASSRLFLQGTAGACTAMRR